MSVYVVRKPTQACLMHCKTQHITSTPSCHQSKMWWFLELMSQFYDTQCRGFLHFTLKAKSTLTSSPIVAPLRQYSFGSVKEELRVRVCHIGGSCRAAVLTIDYMSFCNRMRFTNKINFFSHTNLRGSFHCS